VGRENFASGLAGTGGASGTGAAAHRPRPEFIALNTNSGCFAIGPDHPASSHKLEGAGSVQARRPVHCDLYHASHRQSLGRGEQDSPTADIQSLAYAFPGYGLRLDQPIPHFLLERESARQTTIATSRNERPPEWIRKIYHVFIILSSCIFKQ
jgi:hypothetical protein